MTLLNPKSQTGTLKFNCENLQVRMLKALWLKFYPQSKKLCNTADSCFHLALLHSCSYDKAIKLYTDFNQLPATNKKSCLQIMQPAPNMFGVSLYPCHYFPTIFRPFKNNVSKNTGLWLYLYIKRNYKYI